MRDVLVGRKLFETQAFFNRSLNHFNITRVLPNIAHNLLIPGCTHLSTSLEAFQALEANHQHYFIEDEVSHFVQCKNVL